MFLNLSVVYYSVYIFSLIVLLIYKGLASFLGDCLITLRHVPQIDSYYKSLVTLSILCVYNNKKNLSLGAR